MKNWVNYLEFKKKKEKWNQYQSFLSQAQFLMQPNFSIFFSFIDHAFDVVSKNYASSQKVPNFLLGCILMLYRFFNLHLGLWTNVSLYLWKM